MRRALAAAGIGLTVLFLGAQAIPTPGLANPPIDPQKTIEASLEVPEGVERVLNKSCRNCHSYQTEVPWYGALAPMSWMLEKDVKAARQAVNLSDWAVTNGRRPGTAMGALAAACAGIEGGIMPPKRYLLMHPEAQVTKDEARTFCSWTAAEIRQIKAEATAAQGQ